MRKAKSRVLSVFMALTLALTMLVGMPLSAKGADGDYNEDDIAVINSIISTNGLGLTPAAGAQLTGDGYPSDWDGYVFWSTDATNKRIVELHLVNEGLTGDLDVTGLDALEWLNVVENNLTSLDASGLTNLRLLDCYYNNISTLNVSGCTALRDLWCWNNSLSTLDVSGCTALRDLWCWNNSLSTLDLTGLFSLTWLNCGANNLTALDLSDNTALVNLLYYENNLSTLALTGLTDLEVLVCSNNGITALTLTGLTKLGYIDSGFNELSTLALTGLSNLEILYCNNNRLTALDVTGLSNLEVLSCEYNFMTSLSMVTGLGDTTKLPDVDTTDGATAFFFSPQRVYVCEIGATKYETLDAALAAVPTGGATPTVIKLLVDITKDDYTEINNQNIIFDLDGKNLIFAGGLGVTDTSAVDYTNAGAGLFAVIVEWDSSTDYDVFYVLYVSGGSTCRLMYVEIVGIGDGENQLLGAVTCWTGSTIIVEGDVVAMHNGDSWAVGVLAEYDNTETSTVTVNGDIITNGDGIWAYEGTTVTINGDIEAGGNGIYAFDSTTVTINGDIEAGGDGIYASGSTVTVTGGINAGFDGVYISSGSPTVVVVDGEIHAGWVGVNIDSWDGPTRDASVTVNSDIFAYYAGVATWECVDCIVTVNGNITADYIGVFAWTGVEVFVNGNIVVTEDAALSLDSILVGVAAGFGAEVTVDGTITVKEGHYIALYFEDAGDPGYSYVFVAPDGNVTPSSKDKFLEYNDSDELQLVSTVWVKDPRTLTPGTGDGTALWLMLGALMVAALGCGLVFAHRRREQQEEA